jgi:hypothetical protein
MVGEGRPRLYFVRVPETKTIKNRVHLDIMPADRTQEEEITRLTGLGARIVSDRRPEFGWVLLADPEGNEFDVESASPNWTLPGQRRPIRNSGNRPLEQPRLSGRPLSRAA